MFAFSEKQYKRVTNLMLYKMFEIVFQSYLTTMLIVGIVISSKEADAFQPSKSFCQPIATTTCSFSSSSGYASTRFPNDVHRTEDEANKDLTLFDPLVKVGCHKDAKLFFCSHYIPLCIEDLKIVLKPCRNLCEQTKAGCSRLMANFGFEWPFNCTALPEEGSACVSGQSPETTTIPATTGTTVATSSNNTEPSTTKKTKPNKGKKRRQSKIN